MTKCYESSALPSRILKTNFEDPGLREEQPLVHDVSGQHHDPIKSGTVHILSNPWDALSLGRREATRDARWRFCSWLFSLVWLVPPKKRKLSKVSQRYQGRSDVGGGLGCVCPPFVVSLCGSTSTLYPSNWSLSHLLALDLSRFVSVSPLLCLNWLSCVSPALVTEKEDQSNHSCSSCLWHPSSGSLRVLSSPSFSLTSVLHYSRNPALFSQVRPHGPLCTRGGKPVKDDAGANKKTRTKISKGNFHSRLSGKWRAVCIASSNSVIQNVQLGFSLVKLELAD